MTAKRVTIGAKPTLVRSEAAGPAGGESEVPGAPAEAGPSSASPASIEDWLRNGETSADEKAAAPAAAQEEPAERETAPAPVLVAAPPEATAGSGGPAAGGEAAAPMPSRRTGSNDLPPWVGIAGAAAVGAAVAVAVALLMPRFLPVTDARLAPLAERVSNVEIGLRTTGERIGKLNNEMAQSLDDQSSAEMRIEEQASELGALKQAFAEASQRTDPATGIDSPVFSVALGQLRTTFYAGRPFEAELMNVYALAGNNDLFAGYLTELMGPARTGVPNAAELHRVFPSYVAAAGLRIGTPEGYYQYGMSLVNRYVVATESYKFEAANLAVTRADRLLASGDVAAAMAVLRDVDAQYVTVMAPWLDAARNYLRNETAITEMTRIVVDRLRDKIAKELPMNDSAEPSSADPMPGEPATLAPAPGAAVDVPPAAVPAATDPVPVLDTPLVPAPEASVDLTPSSVPSAVPAEPVPQVPAP